MSDASLRLAQEPDFSLGSVTISPSTGRVIAGDDEIRVEALTMAVLLTLARANGATVSREALVEACWQGRIVSDDAVGRAIAKVRALERCRTPAAFAVETVPKIGYRLLIKAAVEPRVTARANKPALPFAWPPRRAGIFTAGAVATALVIALAVAATTPRPAAQASAAPGDAAHSIRVADFSDALLALDERRLDTYLRRGWDPNWKLDSEGNAALHNLMMVCERNPTHDQAGVVRVARLLVRAGADPTVRNKWSDTPLTIAATPRYCGPGHPVVAYLKTALAARGATANPSTAAP